MGRQTKGKYTAEQFVAAIDGSGGIIATIAKRVGCDWNTAKKYIDKLPSVTRAYLDECERVTDAAESVLIRSIVDDKDIASAKWWLTRKGRDRGFADAVDVQQSGEVTLRIVYDD